MGDLIPFAAKPAAKAGSPAPPAGAVAVSPDAMIAHYAQFPARWQAFLHAHFAGPVAVSQFFGVTERAALKWWHGANGPQGAKVAWAVERIPGAAPMLFAVAA